MTLWFAIFIWMITFSSDFSSFIWKFSRGQHFWQPYLCLVIKETTESSDIGVWSRRVLFSCFIYTPFGRVLLTDLLLEVGQEHSLRGIYVPKSHNWLCCCQSLNCNLTSALHEDAADKTKMCNMNRNCFQSLHSDHINGSICGGLTHCP